MKVTYYKCECCGAIHSHKDSYNDQYCYDCIDIDTGKLKKDLADPKPFEMPDDAIFTNIIPGGPCLTEESIKQAIKITSFGKGTLLKKVICDVGEGRYREGAINQHEKEEKK